MQITMPRHACQAGLLALLICYGASAQTPAVSASPLAAVGEIDVGGIDVGDIDILAYTATIEPRVAEGEVVGEERIRFVARRDGVRQVRFDRGALEIGAVTDAHGARLTFDTPPRTLSVILPRPLRDGEPYELRLDYRGRPTHGLQFDPARRESYTIFSTSQWLVCVDAPHERATLDLTLIVPAGSVSAANGRHSASRSLGDGREAHRWRLTRDTPSFLYGFAIGPYREWRDARLRPQLRALSIDRTPEELSAIFAETRGMIAFFQVRAGIAYPGRTYTQVLVSKTAGQEAAGLAFLSEEEGEAVLTTPDRIGLIAHEIAHQWWGDLLTCRDWGHFWLNEGFATFMAAAYREHRDGRAHYDAQVARWRDRVERLRADGRDRPLVYPEWNRPTADDRAVVYQKGAYVLHLLRETLGEDAFWAGVRDYTRAHAGSSVATVDLQRAMERASGQDLQAFFDAHAGPAAGSSLPAPE